MQELDQQPISGAFPFESTYVQVGGSKIHYVEQGTGDPILFLHGNPTWSYLWRNIIPHLSSLGRCVAPDLIGMGQSDKPDINYRFFDHVEYIDEFIGRLQLTNITLVMHDWGSAIGFYYAMRNEENVKRLAFMEALLAPAPNWEIMPERARALFQSFRIHDVGWDLIVNKNILIEQVLPGAILRKLTDEEMNHYRAPYIDPASRKPLWRWPNEIPVGGEPRDVADAVAEYNKWLQETDLPKLLFYATPGAIIRAPLVQWCKQNLKNLQIVDVGSGIHFIQEDHPHRIGTELAAWCRAMA